MAVFGHGPALAGLVEAVSFIEGVARRYRYPLPWHNDHPFSVADLAEASAAEWNIGLVNLMFEGQVEAAYKQAALLTNDRLHRLDAIVSAGDFTLDDAGPEKIERLMNLGRSEAVKKEHLEDIEERFLNGIPAEPFRPSGKERSEIG